MRSKHGQYNRERKLPDNTGQAVGGGLVIRFQEQVKIHFPDLLEASVRGDHGRQWLLDRLRAMKDPQAQIIVQEYAEQRRKDARVRSQRDRYRSLRQLREQSATADARFQAGFRKRIEHVERQIEKATLQHGELLTNMEIQKILQ